MFLFPMQQAKKPVISQLAFTYSFSHITLHFTWFSSETCYQAFLFTGVLRTFIIMCEHIEMTFSLVLKSTNDFQGNEMWHSMVWGNFKERNRHTNGVMPSALLERRLAIYLHCIAISGILSKNKSIAQVLGSYGSYWVTYHLLKSFAVYWLLFSLSTHKLPTNH